MLVWLILDGKFYIYYEYLFISFFTYRYLFNLNRVTGHTYITYGPLSLGTTTVLFESTPTCKYIINIYVHLI